MIYKWQQQQWQTMMHLRQAQRLPHAVLLHGPEGTGKHHFARAMAGALLCRRPDARGHACGHCDACGLLAAGTHPDLAILRPLPPEKSTSKNPVLNIRIDDIRALCARLGTTSQFGGHRVAIIEDADHLVIAAANALLKTLEEPGPDTLLILVSSRPHRLPVTIRSRCQATRFPAPGREQALEWLQEQGVARPGQALDLAHGAPLLAATLDGDRLQQREILGNALLAASHGESSLNYSQQLAEMPKDVALGWLLDWTADLVRLKNGGPEAALVNTDRRDSLHKLAQKTDARRLFDYYDQVCGYIRKEGIALNMQFVWENLLVSWDRL